MFVSRGDWAMPSIAITAARFASQHNVGTFGENLYANTVFDPKKKDGKNAVVYFDSDDEGKEGGNLRLLNGPPAWYTDRMVISSSAADSPTAMQAIRRHVNFLCSVRGEPVFCEEDQIWYRLLHIRLIGRIRRPGRTSAGQELYEGTLEIKWRPMSSADPDYVTVTGIT